MKIVPKNNLLQSPSCKNFSKRQVKKSAFSLIELSIVLIIIGLLIAGVTGGASLIKSSELRSVIGEARAFAISVNAFYNQFNYLPGDYGTAISSSVATSNTTIGDSDGKIEYLNSSTPAVNEGRNAWFQMKNAGILDAGVISAVANTTNIVPVTTAITNFGVAIPASKIKSAGWDFDYNSSNAQNVVVLTGAIGSSGSATDTLVNGTVQSSAAIAAIDALAIDTKVDDGLANSGKIRGINTSATCYADAAYSTSQAAKNCALSYQVDINS